MPARSPEQLAADQAQQSSATRETWIDWLSPEGRDVALQEAEPLLTRDQLVTELRDRGHDVSARNLIHWQAVGAIPYPTRQTRHGKSFAAYPQWMINVVHTLRNLQEHGYGLREIGPFIRGDLYHLFTPQPQTPEQEARQARIRARQALYPLFNELEPLVGSLARIHEHLHNDHIVGAEIRLIREDGTAETYLVSTSQTNDQPPTSDVVKAEL